MAQPSPSRIVHESEAQRQFVRVKLPATIQFTADGARKQFQLHDISAGGFSFDPGSDTLKVGAVHTGHVVLNVDSVGFTIPVTFEVRTVDAQTGRVGCFFQELGIKEVSALRQVITSFLGGELVSTGEMLTTLSRENFVRARSGGGGLSAGGKLRAIIGTSVALVVGLVAFSYAAIRLYDLVFVTHATAAKVAATTFTINMPRDGTFFPLVKEGGTIKKGQAVGQFETALLQVVEGVSGSFKLTAEQLTALIGEQLRGSIASPCDCIVQKAYSVGGQYVLRNQAVMELVPEGTKPYILARFHYDQMKRLPIGREVVLRVNGSPETLTGKVTNLRVLPAPTIDSNGLNDLNGLDTSAAITDIIAVITPDVELETSRIDQPVEIFVDPLNQYFR
ncbi:MAG: PilZ domain-containing protein [Gammaproteobacteria bacterium]|nr:PilZ domain-containing protein [Gammaproteobacteria bacterium]